MKISKLIPIIIVIIIGLYFGSKMEGVSLDSLSQTVTFDKMSNEHFEVSQFIVHRPWFRKPSAAADLTLNTNLEGFVGRLELQAVFYDDKENRVGIATGLVDQDIKEGQKTTVKLKFDDDSNIKNIAGVRMELNQLAMLDLMERLVDGASNLK